MFPITIVTAILRMTQTAVAAVALRRPGLLSGALMSRCMPEEEPPPRRFAASASGMVMVRPRASTAASSENVFIEDSEGKS